MQHRTQPVRPLGSGWHAERDTAVLDALFGPGDAAGHGRLRHQESAGDFRGRQAADRPQGEGDLRGGGQRRVATQEEQDEGVVLISRTGPLRDDPAVRGRRHPALRQRPGRQHPLALPAGLLAAQQVGQPAGSDGDEPAAGIVRKPVALPLRDGRDQCFLDRVLGGVEVPVPAHHGTEDLRRQSAQQALERLCGVGHAVVSPRTRRRRRRSAGCPRTGSADYPDRVDSPPAGRRSRSRGRSCRTRRSCNRPAPPASPRTARR